MASNTRVYKRFPYRSLQRPGQYVDIQLERIGVSQEFGRIFERNLITKLRRAPLNQLMQATPVLTGSMRDSTDMRRLSTVKRGDFGVRTSYKAPYAVYNMSKEIFNAWTASPVVRLAAYESVLEAHQEIRRIENRRAERIRQRTPSYVRGRASRRNSTRFKTGAVRVLLYFVSSVGRYIGRLV